MKGAKFLIMLIPILMVNFGFTNKSLRWERQGAGILETEINHVHVDPRNKESIFVGTAKALYQSTDSGQSYLPILFLTSADKRVNDIKLSSTSSEIYVATDSGLYKRSKRGTWEKIFYSSDSHVNTCLSVLIEGGIVYLGTLKGLFMKKAESNEWGRINGVLTKKNIFSIHSGLNKIYLLTENKVFSLDKSNSQIHQMFSSGQEEEVFTRDEVPAYTDRIKLKKIKLLKIDSNKERMYLVTSKGIFISNNHGEAWTHIVYDSLPLNEITSMVVKSDVDVHNPELLIGSLQGVFYFKGNKWSQIFNGLDTNTVYHLAHSNHTIYSATNSGLFYLTDKKAVSSKKVNTSKQVTKAKEVLKKEPTITEVHEWAIDYAEVNPKKINQWRDQASKAAWLPSLSVGFDSSKDWARSDSIWGTSSGSHHIGPDDKTFGEDVGFDVSLSWDLSELIWNSDQTSIDSRSKLMVELREEVLDRITRLYFERRRLQHELMLANLYEGQILNEKQMRLDELTALIDALTGGAFSRNMNDDGMDRDIERQGIDF